MSSRATRFGQDFPRSPGQLIQFISKPLFKHNREKNNNINETEQKKKKKGGGSRNLFLDIK